jgi:glutamine amidotransferase
VKALGGAGRSIVIESNPLAAIETDVLILPGVGAFAPAAAALAPARTAMRDALLTGLPCLGICLGMQLLCESSDEGVGDGLGIVHGRVARLTARRVPQIGWNTLSDTRDPLLASSGLTTAYYANGFVCRVADPSVVTSWSTHENDRFPATVRRGRVMGVQFHPEKSSAPGVRFLRGFLDAATQ